MKRTQGQMVQNSWGLRFQEFTVISVDRKFEARAVWDLQTGNMATEARHVGSQFTPWTMVEEYPVDMAEIYGDPVGLWDAIIEDTKEMVISYNHTGSGPVDPIE